MEFPQRPALLYLAERPLKAAQCKQGLPAGETNELGIDVARISGQVKASSVKKISEVVENHPDESLQIIRTWLAEEHAGSEPV